MAAGAGPTTYNGTVWTTYTRENSGLISDSVSALTADADETVWVGTEYKGLASFDGVNWISRQTANSGLPQNFIRTVTVTDDGKLWAGTLTESLAYFDGVNWTVYNSSNSGLPDDDVRSIAVEDDGTVWIGTTDGGLAEFDGTDWTVFTYNNSALPGGPVVALTIDSAGTLWIGVDDRDWALGEFGGLVSFDGTNLVTYEHPPYLDFGITSIAIGNDGIIWFGEGGGLGKYDGINWEEYTIYDFGLLSTEVSEVATEDDGTVWIGNWHGGMASFDGTNWVAYTTANSGLPDNSVNALMVNNGLTWIGTQYKGMATFDGNNWTIYNPYTSPMPTEHIYRIVRDNFGTTWIATSSGVVGYNVNGVPQSTNEKVSYSQPLKVYPNPASNFVTIECISHSGMKRAELFDLQGRLRKRVSLMSTGKTTIDLKSLSGGIYLIKVFTDIGVYHTKLLVE